MRFQHAAQFDTELLIGDTVIEHGSTLLPGPHPVRFDPLRNWAQLCANVEDQPVTWRAIKAGDVVMQGSCYPRDPAD